MSWLFPTEPDLLVAEKTSTDVNWKNTQLNQERKAIPVTTYIITSRSYTERQAVLSIVFHGERKVPYLISGPPGWSDASLSDFS